MWDSLGTNPAPSAGADANASGLQTEVGHAVRRSIEDMIFLPVEKATMLMASIQVLDPVKGRVGLVVDRRLARQMALDMYACEPKELTDQMVTDFVAELINTISGQMMSDVLPDEQLFQLGLPDVTEGASLAYAGDTHSFFVQVKSCCVVVNLSGDSLVDLFSTHKQ